MVSYYNSLSSMFPGHHGVAQPHSVAAAAVAARHAASYLQSYHHHHYGYSQPHHQYSPSATSPGGSSSTTTTTPSGQYPANLADLNSNVCGASGSIPSAISGSSFGPILGGPPHHQHLDPGNGFQPNPAITPPAWPHHSSAWHATSPFWPSGPCNPPATTGSAAPTSGSNLDTILPTNPDAMCSIGPNAARSPDSPNRDASVRHQHGGSPIYANGSHSSGSPTGTPTPSGAYPGEFNDYSAFHMSQHHQSQHQLQLTASHHQQQQQDSRLHLGVHHQQQQQELHHLQHPLPNHGSPADRLDDDDDDDCDDEDDDDERHGLSPTSPLSPTSGGNLSSRPQPARSPYEWMKKPSYQSQPDKSGRTRTKDKYRIVYSDHQRLELEKEFHYSRYITIRRKAELANSVGLSERQVKIWFQNRRAKERRALKKHEDVIMKEKLESAASFGAAMGSYHHHQDPLGGGCHPAMMASHGMGAAAVGFPPHSLAGSIMSPSPQLSLGGAMKFE